MSELSVFKLLRLSLNHLDVQDKLAKLKTIRHNKQRLASQLYDPTLNQENQSEQYLKLSSKLDSLLKNIEKLEKSIPKNLKTINELREYLNL